MPNISEILKTASAILQASGIAEPRREANSLLAFALQKEKTFLIAHSEYELSDAENVRFGEFIKRRANREPFQYITGRQEFYGLDFLVTPDVLIPRPETEILVENAIEILRAKANPSFCEIGVGSGCISVSLLHEIEKARAISLDISEKALRIAGENARRHAVAERLALKFSDVFSALENESFDLIVSNPPYISSKDVAELQPEVRDFEPHTALTDGKSSSSDGLSIVEKIIVQSPRFLKPNGFLMIEIGFDQSSKVSRMFDRKVWREIEFLQDLQGIRRVAKALKAD